jgi:hypothetical protein
LAIKKSPNKCCRKFLRNCDYEKHLESHDVHKNFGCNLCDKKFFLQKHMAVHDESTKSCHFFNYGKLCPYENIGCMFRHVKAGKCTFANCMNSLCQYDHNLVENILIDDEHPEETDSESEIENQTEEEQVQCNMCECTFLDNVELNYHMKVSHVDQNL